MLKIVILFLILLTGCKKLPVHQEGEVVSLDLISDRCMTIGSKGGLLKIELKSNSDIKVEAIGLDWLRLSETRAMTAYTVYIEVDPNESYDERNAAITFTSGDKKQIVTITQKQKDALLLSSNKVEVEASGGEVSLEIKSNVDYEIITYASWIEVLPETNTKALEEKEIKLFVKENNGFDQRSTKVYVRSGVLVECVDIYQSGMEPTLILGQKEFIVGSAGDTINVEIKTNSFFTYEMQFENQDMMWWVYPDVTRSISSYTYNFIVSPNDTFEPRKAKIIFTNQQNNKKDTLNIFQNQQNAIILSENEYSFDYRAHSLSFDVLSNVEFEVKSSADWIVFPDNTATKALVEKTLTIQICKNNFKEPREAIISLQSNDVNQKIKIYQAELTERIRLDINHNKSYMQVPMFDGDNVYGDVYWGDGKVEEYRKKLSHSFFSSEEKTSVFDIIGSDKFVVENISGISSFVLYREKDNTGGVENVSIDKKKWD